MSLSKRIGVVGMNTWTRVLTSAVKAIIYEALGFSRHNIDLEFDEEHMKAERLTKAPDNAGIDPGTIKMKTWYQEPIREGDDSQLPSSSRASDALSGTDRTSYQVREPIEDDEERLAMKQGDMAPPVPERVANPRIQGDRAVQEFQSNSDKMHRATSDDAFTQAWFNYCRNVFSQSVRKTGTNGDIYSVSTNQCSILFNNVGSSNRKSEFRKAENMRKPATKVQSSTSPSCHFSENSGETNTRMSS